MSEIQKDTSQNNEIEPDNELSLGALLKDEREKKGLSLDEVAKITRLRKHFLEALENEDWDILPAPVFMKGFIKSYAQTLGLDERKALDLYKKIAPFEEEPPKPLVETKGSKNQGIFLGISLLGVVMAVIIYLFTGQQASVPDKKKHLSESREEMSKQPTPPQGEIPTPVKESVSVSIRQEPGAEPAGAGKPEKLPIAQEQLPLVVEAAANEPASEPDPVVIRFALTGIVNMRTYVKIYIDDMLPREYIFRPGSRPQWDAREGFDILVGNAAGIEFDFNGKRIKDLGGLGKVIRVRFPKDFESRIYGE